MFAFGPAEARDYGVRNNKWVPADLSQSQENKLRSPIFWLAGVQIPTWMIEGTEGYLGSLRDIAKASTNT